MIIEKKRIPLIITVSLHSIPFMTAQFLTTGIILFHSRNSHKYVHGNKINIPSGTVEREG